MRALFHSVDRMESAMTFHRERHSALASNVANVDTPNYRPVDLEQVAGSELNATPGAMELARTSARHLGAASGSRAPYVVVDASGNAGADGNRVSLEHEMAKIDANRVRYATNAELVSRRMALLRYAAGDGLG